MKSGHNNVSAKGVLGQLMMERASPDTVLDGTWALRRRATRGSGQGTPGTLRALGARVGL